MLQSISWQTYYKACISISLVYYTVIVLLYYRRDLLARLKTPSTFQQPIEFPPVMEPDHADYQSKVSQDYELPGRLDSGMSNDLSELFASAGDEIKAFTASLSTQYNKTILITGLQKLLKRYAVLQGSPLQTTLNDTIAAACITHCSTRLGDQEINGLWDD